MHNIIAVAASSNYIDGEDYRYIVGLKADGTVDVVGDKYYRNRTKDWRNIVAVATGDNHIVGLKADGTVVSDGLGVKYNHSRESVESTPCNQCNTKGWRDIVAIAAGNYHTVGLKADGTVVAVGDNDDRQCNIRDWHDIVAIYAQFSSTVGLKADGTVVAVGESLGQRNTILRNAYINCNLPFKSSDFTVDNSHNWRDIVAVADGSNHRVGLKADGTVVACGLNSYGQCNTTNWRNIVAVLADSSNTYGLKADGTIVAAGQNDDEQSNIITGWKNIGYPSEEQVLKMKQSLQWKAEGKCPKCGGDTTGLGKCKSCGEGGCYVATCVYGSYDCPEVWTLRRFRDNSLSNSWFGMQFIQMYYAISPKIVDIFGNKKWFNLICKSVLDKFIRKLQNNGVDNSPYSDC